MLSYKELFRLGSDFQTYVELGSDEDIKSVSDIRTQCVNELPRSTLEKLNEIEKDIHILVAGDVSCSDCRLNLTALHHMSLIQPKIKYSIISKECAEQHILKYLEFQQIKIPLMLILDSNFKLTQLFVERPLAVNSVGDFDEIKEAYLGGKYLTDTMNEILNKFDEQHSFY
mgnify:CR=1 FL=1